MIVALEEAKRRLVALEDVLAQLKNQLRIDEAKEKVEELAGVMEKFNTYYNEVESVQSQAEKLFNACASVGV